MNGSHSHHRGQLVNEIGRHHLHHRGQLVDEISTYTMMFFPCLSTSVRLPFPSCTNSRRCSSSASLCYCSRQLLLSALFMGSEVKGFRTPQPQPLVPTLPPRHSWQNLLVLRHKPQGPLVQSTTTIPQIKKTRERHSQLYTKQPKTTINESYMTTMTMPNGQKTQTSTEGLRGAKCFGRCSINTLVSGSVQLRATLHRLMYFSDKTMLDRGVGLGKAWMADGSGYIHDKTADLNKLTAREKQKIGLMPKQTRRLRQWIPTLQRY